MGEAQVVSAVPRRIRLGVSVLVVATVLGISGASAAAADLGLSFRLVSSAYYVAASPQNVNQVAGLGNVQALEVGFGFGDSFAVAFAQEAGTLGAGQSGTASTFTATLARFRLTPGTSRVGLAVALGSTLVGGPFAGFGATGEVGIQVEPVRAEGELYRSAVVLELAYRFLRLPVPGAPDFSGLRGGLGVALTF